MKIKSKHPESQGPYVLINDEDFDPATMEAFEPEGVAPAEELTRSPGRPRKAEERTRSPGRPRKAK